MIRRKIMPVGPLQGRFLDVCPLDGKGGLRTIYDEYPHKESLRQDIAEEIKRREAMPFKKYLNQEEMDRIHRILRREFKSSEQLEVIVRVRQLLKDLLA